MFFPSRHYERTKKWFIFPFSFTYRWVPRRNRETFYLPRDEKWKWILFDHHARNERSNTIADNKKAIQSVTSEKKKKRFIWPTLCRLQSRCCKARLSFTFMQTTFQFSLSWASNVVNKFCIISSTKYFQCFVKSLSLCKC